MYGASIDWIIDRILKGLAGGEAVGSDGLRLVLHVFASTGREDLRAALGPALGSSLVTANDAFTDDLGPGRLLLLAETVAVSDDDALSDGVARLTGACRAGWPGRGTVARAVAEVEACLAAGTALSDMTVVAAAVDELERVVRHVYEPGEGVSSTIATRSRTPGDLRDQMAVASALLRAHAVTDRLPYAMLAEELVQYAVRGWWNASDAAFADGGDAAERPDLRRLSGFTVNCLAARVLCRLAALHEDSVYRTMAAVGQRIDYAERARLTLSRLDEVYQLFGIDSAPYGLALEEWPKTRMIK